MPANLQIVGVDGNLISSSAMIAVHKQSPRSGVCILLRYFASLTFLFYSRRLYRGPHLFQGACRFRT